MCLYFYIFVCPYDGGETIGVNFLRGVTQQLVGLYKFISNIRKYKELFKFSKFIKFIIATNVINIIMFIFF